ncbi:MAG: hypothetical protein CM15mP95_2680 [Alphaproteobacteria bacterium]|nr:MAG: hypothetical protein CM15mP95_2680 [Alphaproteobacteria bacterium]
MQWASEPLLEGEEFFAGGVQAGFAVRVIFGKRYKFPGCLFLKMWGSILGLYPGPQYVPCFVPYGYLTYRVSRYGVGCAKISVFFEWKTPAGKREWE